MLFLLDRLEHFEGKIERDRRIVHLQPHFSPLFSSIHLDDPPFHTHHGPLDNRDAIVLVEGDQGTPDFAAEGHKLPDDRSVPIA
ncbi:hypothetical protein SDC9_12086 [bioreactor metagenome]|uniref:Uncharacterized protein n=1 Tax=bioreactor metagenome TaxID=1076179 RepID=A0A644TJE4_9ZZZZ